MKAVIHFSQAIAWQAWRAGVIRDGLEAQGIRVETTSDRFRHGDGFPILLGTTLWRGIENDGGDFLLVDRCSFGDTNRFVSLVWNGHGRRGDHRVPENYDASRWEKHGFELAPWRDGPRRILCGQVESYSPKWPSLDAWYASIDATHFRRHPSGLNPTGLPDAGNFDDCGLAITLNSSVGVQAVMAGVPTRVDDEGSMVWDFMLRADRLTWCHWLAWTQWSDDELREGTPWAYLL